MNRYQANAAKTQSELEGQMAVVVALRALCPKLMNMRLQRELFYFTLTDLHESSIMVDSQYHITGVVDIEWSCVLPREVQHPPFWLGGDEFNVLYGAGTREKEEKFESAYEEFLQILEQEDEEPFSICPREDAQAMRESFRLKRHWFLAAVKMPQAEYNLFLDCIQPQIAPTHSTGKGAIAFQDIMAGYWSADTLKFADQKRRDWNIYLHQLRSVHSSAIRPY